jgi:hypothetical protein
MTDFLKKLAIANDRLLMLGVMKFTDIFSMDAWGAEAFCDVQNISRSNTMEQLEVLDAVFSKEKTELFTKEIVRFLSS